MASIKAKYLLIQWDDCTYSVHPSKDVCATSIEKNGPVSMQVKNVIWNGEINSVWETKANALKEEKKICGSKNIFNEQAEGTRERKKKIFNDDFVDEDEPVKKTKKKQRKKRIHLLQKLGKI